MRDGGADGTEPVEVTTLDTSTQAMVARVLRGIAARPTRLFRELNRAYHLRLLAREYNPRGIDVFEEDWDTLVVLDACRFDTFEEHHALPGRLESRTSRGSDTYQFLVGNLRGRSLLDTVYVTANPRLLRRRADVDVEFHDVVNVWREGWDEEHGTVLPETTTEYAVEAAREHPKKRLVVHYLQPHYPFIESDIESGEMVDQRNPSVWDLVITGEVDPDEIRRAYERNLDRTLPAVERLLSVLSGKTVVTSDHGNMLGEPSFPLPYPEWGHPLGIYTEELVRVPWLVHDSGPRRRITAGEPAGGERDDVEDATVEERLEQLGYRS